MDDIQQATYCAIAASGPTYGRKLTTGLLRSCGLNIGERLVGRTLNELAPAYAERRRMHTERHMNPVPYYAEYAGSL